MIVNITIYQDQFYWDDKDEGECANHVKVQDGLLPNADGWINWELSSAFNNKGLLDQVQKYESDQQAALLNANRQINPGSVIKPGEIKNHAEKLMRSSSEGFEGFSKELERFCTGKSLKIGRYAHHWYLNCITFSSHLWKDKSDHTHKCTQLLSSL